MWKSNCVERAPHFRRFGIQVCSEILNDGCKTCRLVMDVMTDMGVGDILAADLKPALADHLDKKIAETERAVEVDDRTKTPAQ